MFVFLILANFTYAQQFAIIKDKDGYVNVHEDANVKSRIIGKIYKDSLFAYDGEKAEWNYVSFKFYGGYLHHSRIYPISNFPSIKNKKVYKDSCITENDTLTLKIKSSKFNLQGHKIRRKSNIVELIDGKRVWGTDGGLPKISISRVEVIIKGEKVIIPPSAYDDLYEPSFNTTQIYIRDDNIIYIEMTNSDGAGGYSIIWTIKNGKYFGRNIDNSEV